MTHGTKPESIDYSTNIVRSTQGIHKQLSQVDQDGHTKAKEWVVSGNYVSKWMLACYLAHTFH